MNKGKVFPPEIYSKGHIDLIMKEMNPKCSTGCRNRAILSVLHGAGLRVSECMDLKPTDINLDTGKIFIKEGKGKEFRTIGISQTKCSMVQIWMNKRKQLGFNGIHNVFITLKGNPVSSTYCRELLARISKKIEKKHGIKQRLNPHSMRHTMVSELCDEGWNICDIRDQLGHKSVATTEKYIRKINPKQLIDKMYRRK